MTPPPGARNDEPVILATARGGEVVPAVEDRSYLAYVAAALAVALLGGFVLAVLVPLTAIGTLPWAERLPELIQAHGWAQLQGWAGIFVAGMGLRLIPRFAGRHPIPVTITLPVLALLLAGVVLRTLLQPAAGRALADVGLLAGVTCSAVAMLSFAGTLGYTLHRGRKRPEPWRYFAWAGAVWWAAWAVLVLAAGVRATANDGLVPGMLDEASTWVVFFGAIANFIWAIQSRSVPVFFGRRPPTLRRVLAPGALLNAGVLLVLLSILPWSDAAATRLEGLGLTLAGLATAWLAPLAGSISGRAHRLRPRARAASRFVLAADWWAMVAGALAMWAGIASLASGRFELFGVRDAARHALGIGLISMLIVGMAQLVAPVFALERAEARPPGVEYVVGWPALFLAAGMRVAAGVLFGHMGERARMELIAAAGVLGWIGIAAFAWSVVRARQGAAHEGAPHGGSRVGGEAQPPPARLSRAAMPG